jgi:hypothetical protein
MTESGVSKFQANPQTGASFPGSAGSLPEPNFVGKLPTNAGWQPALPGSESQLQGTLAPCH